MKLLKKCLTAAAILGLCAFGACKKKDEQHPAQQQQATEAAHALLQVSREIAKQIATVAIEEYIPADAVLAIVSSPDINITQMPIVSMFKDEELKPDGAEQIAIYMKPEFTAALVTFASADKAQEIINKNASKPDANARTAGSGNRQWTVCGPFKSKDDETDLYRAYHAEGKTVFFALATSLDDKTLDSLLDKPAASHPINQLRKQKGASAMAFLDNVALIQHPGTLAPFHLSQEKLSSFLNEQKIKAEFVKNFPTTQMALRSDDTGTSIELQINFADPADAARLSALAIPGPDLPKDPAVAAANVNIDLPKAYDWFTEIAAKVDIATLPDVLQQPVQMIKLHLEDADSTKYYREILSRFGAASFEVYKFAQSSDYALDLEGRDLNKPIEIEGEDSADKDIKLTPIAFVNTAIMGFMMSVTHMIPDNFIEADKIIAATLKSPDTGAEGDKFYVGANDDRIVFANTEADVKQILDKKPQLSARTDLIGLEISEQTLLRTNPFFSKSPKPIAKIAMGLGAADNGIKIHIDWTY